jgi:hypothetical protein
MMVTITVNGAPVADGSTIHLPGGASNSTAICVTIDFPSAQGTYTFSDAWWTGRVDNHPTPPAHQMEVHDCSDDWDGPVGSCGDYKTDVTWFEANGTIDHQVITIHVVFD